MDILYLLIPFSVLLIFLIVAVFAWALHNGQMEDLEEEGARIFQDEAFEAPPSRDASPGARQKEREIESSTKLT